MSRYDQDLRAYAAATDRDAEGVRRRLAAGRIARRPGAARRTLPVLGALAAAAAVAVVAWPEAPPEPVARPFADRGEDTLGDAVHVRWEGSGAAAGHARALALSWEAGSIAVEVEPDRGVALSVTTGEATVRVIGTGFEVRRDAFGTGVVVRHGVVGVTCVGGQEERVEAGGSVECLPVTAAALLGRARAQMRRGDPPDAVLATVRRGRVGAEGEVEGELALLEAYELSRAGQGEAALAVADAALTGASTRRVELLRLATRIAVDLGGCPRAQPYADALTALGEATPCEAQGSGR